MKQVATTVLLLITMAMSTSAVAQSLAPFGGNWGGTVRYKQDLLKCTAYNTVKDGGKHLTFTMRCGSVSDNIRARAEISHNKGALSGSWEENRFNTSGSISGNVSDNEIAGKIDSGNYVGSISIVKGGETLMVAIKIADMTISAAMAR